MTSKAGSLLTDHSDPAAKLNWFGLNIGWTEKLKKRELN